MSKTTSNIQCISLEQSQRAALLLFAANIPFILWSSPGKGKSSVMQQLAERLRWRMVDWRGSDKEASDAGGIPFPDGDKVKYLMPAQLPWEPIVHDERVVLFLDEIDRSDRPVQNVMLQLLLDRQVNGMKLGQNVRVCAAGNGATDTATTEISDALATRCVHLYVESKSDSAIESFDKWAEQDGASPMLRAYARTRTDVWAGNGDDKLIELARPNPRTHRMADKIFQFAKQAKFKTHDILRPLICGCVGFEAGMSLIGFNDLYEACPTPEEIFSNPDTAKIPEDAGIIYALSVSLTDKVAGDADGNRAKAEALAQYFLRLPAEQQAYGFNRLERLQPWIVTRPVWQRRVR